MYQYYILEKKTLPYLIQLTFNSNTFLNLFLLLPVNRSSECDVVRGECTQTYVPYLFLVIPLGPVTLTGQDYVLVESGCVCKPKYATGPSQEPNIIP